jgi:lipopolysaccharide/colanic/teichoic acid biosynthesis glycosyltransferase|tara:strand:- start:1483 stop:2046 length:564 start_codon:yes stop_codon:yes gene_type:complete
MIRKRIFDISFSFLFIIIFLWLYLFLGTLIFINDGFPILYRALRKGKNNKIFTCFKFRSMSNHLNPKDRKITYLGNFMRKTNLDEIPQFFNVLIGDMSIVGPRPHDLNEDEFFEKNISNYNDRFELKPGITGYAAVEGNRGGTDIKKITERVKLDKYYIENYSFTLDIKIIFKTIIITISNICNRLF